MLIKLDTIVGKPYRKERGYSFKAFSKYEDAYELWIAKWICTITSAILLFYEARLFLYKFGFIEI